MPWYQAIGIILGIPVIFFGSAFTIFWWVDAICPGCKKRSPDFVWSYGHASKTYCEKCVPSRIKDVFGSNENYLEHLYTKRSKQNA